MVDELAPDTNEKMRALCKKISVAHDLDAEIQEELYSHIEDKLLAYLNGEEILAEEDAFILVREHFGDPSTLKGLLQDAHAFEAQVSLARRLAAAMIVTGGVIVTYSYLTMAVFQVWPALPEIGGYHAFIAVYAPVYVLLPCLLMRHWQRRLDEDRTPWFLTWRPAYLVGAIAVLLVPQSLVSMTGLVGYQPAIEPSGLLWRLVLAVFVSSPVLQCIVWLWWCDRPPRRVRAVGTAAGVWAVWAWSSSSVATIQSVVYSGRASQLRTITQNLALTLCVLMMYAFVGYALYAIARRIAAGFKRRLAKT